MPAYSKTNWVDGSVPAIDATNLNKIEQGIFDSLRQDGSTTMSGQLVTTAGSAATPAIAPTGDSNTGIFFPAADTIAFGEGGLEAMRINSAGNVGIGTTSPANIFSVVSATGQTGINAGTVSSPVKGNLWYDTDGSGWKFQIGKWQSSAFTAQMTIQDNGNIGIGTASPNTTLQVDDTYGGYRAGIIVKNTADGATGRGTGIEWYSGTGTTKGEISLTAIDANRDGYDMKFLTTATGGSKTTKMTITGAGNVGIGTTSPASIANYTISDLRGTTGAFYYVGNSTNYGRFGWNDGLSGLEVNCATNYPLLFLTGGTERMRITSAGNVGIGTTPSTWGSGYTALSIKNAGNSISSSGASQLLLSSNAYDSGAGAWKYNENGYYANLMEIGSNGYLFYTTTSTQGAGNSITWSERMRLNNSGYLLIGYTSSNGAYPLQVNGQIFATSSTIATSDGRYKKDVVALDGALDIVKALNPVQFSWKDHPVHKFNTDVPTVGFIAQEVEQALADKSYLTSIIKKSECTWETETGETVEREVTRDVEKQVTREVEREVTETIDGEEVTRTVTEEITETIIEQVTEIVTEPVKETHTEEFLGIAESNLIAILTKAVKELAAEVEALKAQLNK